MARYETAGQIINDVALEVGLLPANDPYSSQDQAFLQLTGLLNSAGRELVTMYNWQRLQKTYSLTTVEGDTGTYFLPADFEHFINQTGWNESSNLPVPGPLSEQTWSMLTGRDFGSTTLYVSFRLAEGLFELYPSPPPAGIEISFLYTSRNWVFQGLSNDPEDPLLTSDRATSAADVPLFDTTLIAKLLKVKFLAAKGMDIAVAAREFDMVYASITGYDKGAQILSASGSSGYPFINESNVPFTNFGDV